MRAMALLGLLLLVLSGCSGGGDSDGGETTTSSSTTSSASTASGTSTSATGSATTTTTTGAPAPNRAPEVNLTGDASNGTAPLMVNFTLDASDPDGDVLDWTFDADGDGAFEASGTSADLPKTVPFTYNATGEFRAAFNVTDGTDNRTAIHLVVVAEGEGAPALVERDDYFFDPATGMCHAKEYEELAPGVYAWGDWTMVEDNDVDGLQLENNHPANAVPFFNLALEDACTSGDQTAA